MIFARHFIWAIVVLVCWSMLMANVFWWMGNSTQYQLIKLCYDNGGLPSGPGVCMFSPRGEPAHETL